MVGVSDGPASCDGRNDNKNVTNKGLDDSVLLVTHVDVGAASGKFAEELSEAPIRGGDLLISISIPDPSFTLHSFSFSFA